MEHFIGATNNLTLGNNTISGDPSFVNTAGNVVISGLNTFNQNVAILASGNITASDAQAEVQANGFNVTMVAGAAITIQNSGSQNRALRQAHEFDTGARYLLFEFARSVLTLARLWPVPCLVNFC